MQINSFLSCNIRFEVFWESCRPKCLSIVVPSLHARKQFIASNPAILENEGIFNLRCYKISLMGISEFILSYNILSLSIYKPLNLIVGGDHHGRRPCAATRERVKD